MRQSARIFGLFCIGAVSLGGAPEQLSLSPAPALAAERVVCASPSFSYAYCRMDARGGVTLRRQLSSAPCVRGRSWGDDREGVWVDRGCAAEFSTKSSGGGTGAIVGAAVIGGVLGALLGSSGSKHDHRYRTHSSGHRDYRYSDPSPSPYDRYGNANYDRRGRYTGCHGLGCMVDNPDVRDRSQDIDPTPQFDKNGNPNFDTQGNYIGGHGLGTQVDDPDTTPSDIPGQ